MAQSAAPPTPQEVTRKLSIHSAIKPKVRAVAGVERRFPPSQTIEISPCFGLGRVESKHAHLWHRIGFGFS